MASVFVIVVIYCQGDLKKEDGWTRNVAHMGKMGKVPNIFVSKPQWKIRECRRRLKDDSDVS